MTSAGVAVEAVEEVSAADRDAVQAIAAEASAVDQTSPLDDQVRLDLEAGGADGVVQLLARDGDGMLLGYAHLDGRSADVTSAHVVVRPDDRRHGVGRALVRRMSDDVEGVLRAWAHGDLPAAQALAAAEGWDAVRELRKMRLPLDSPIDDAAYPDDVAVRAFVPGQDEDAWVAVNAEAFSHHPEQGRMSADDLRQRERQAWFDPAGLFLAERDGELVGFHWTKVHPAEDGAAALGEVYVVGVRPGEQGSGLGRALTLTGLRHLRDQGLDVVLYVDGDNAPAVRTYERIGFDVASVDVMYERPAR